MTPEKFSESIKAQCNVTFANMKRDEITRAYEAKKKKLNEECMKRKETLSNLYKILHPIKYRREQKRKFNEFVRSIKVTFILLQMQAHMSTLMSSMPEGTDEERQAKVIAVIDCFNKYTLEIKDIDAGEEMKQRKYIKDDILRSFQQQGKGDRPFRMLNKWMENFQENELAGAFRSMRSVKVLRHYAIDTPILLVAASPHLDDTIDQIHEFRDRVYIICCDVAINCLVNHGITPDMVVALDTSPVIAMHFNGIDTSDVKLVCATTIHPNVLKVWMGPVFFFNQRDYIQHKDKFLAQMQRKTTFPAFVNKDYVGACAYQVARYISAQPIILMGYGFAYKDARRYCSGVYPARRQEDIPVEPANALTTTTLIMFCRILEEMIKGDDMVVNCTGGGILQKNNCMTLQEAGERYGIWS